MAYQSYNDWKNKDKKNASSPAVTAQPPAQTTSANTGGGTSGYTSYNDWKKTQKTEARTPSSSGQRRLDTLSRGFTGQMTVSGLVNNYVNGVSNALKSGTYDKQRWDTQYNNLNKYLNDYGSESFTPMQLVGLRSKLDHAYNQTKASLPTFKDEASTTMHRIQTPEGTKMSYDTMWGDRMREEMGDRLNAFVLGSNQYGTELSSTLSDEDINKALSRYEYLDQMAQKKAQTQMESPFEIREASLNKAPGKDDGEDFNTKFERIAGEHPDWTDDQIYDYIDNEDRPDYTTVKGDAFGSALTDQNLFRYAINNLQKEQKNRAVFQKYNNIMSQTTQDEYQTYGQYDPAYGTAEIPEIGFDPPELTLGGKNSDAYAQMFYEAINGNQEAIDYLTTVRDKGSSSYYKAENTPWKYMTEDDVAMFDFLYASPNYGKSAAMEFYNDMLPTLNARQAEADQEYLDNLDVTSKIVLNAIGTVLKPGADITNFGFLIHDIFSGDLDTSDYATSQAIMALRGSLKDDIVGEGDNFARNAGGFLLDALLSSIDNIYGVALGTTITNGLGIVGGMATNISEYTSLAIMSMSATQQSIMDNIARGMPQDRAIAIGFASGLVEFLTEKIGLDNLFNSIWSGKDGFTSLVKQVLSESGEETIGGFADEAIDNLYDAIARTNNSDFRQQMTNYIIENGLSPDSQEEAFYHVAQQKLQEIGMQALSGGFAGGFTGGSFYVGGSVAQNTENRNLAKMYGITDDHVDSTVVDALINEGKWHNTNSSAYKAALKLENLRDSGADTKAQARQASRLVGALTAETNSQDEYAVMQASQEAFNQERARGRFTPANLNVGLNGMVENPLMNPRRQTNQTETTTTTAQGTFQPAKQESRLVNKEGSEHPVHVATGAQGTFTPAPEESRLVQNEPVTQPNPMEDPMTRLQVGVGIRYEPSDGYSYEDIDWNEAQRIYNAVLNNEPAFDTPNIDPALRKAIVQTARAEQRMQTAEEQRANAEPIDPELEAIQDEESRMLREAIRNGVDPLPRTPNLSDLQVLAIVWSESINKQQAAKGTFTPTAERGTLANPEGTQAAETQETTASGTFTPAQTESRLANPQGSEARTVPESEAQGNFEFANAGTLANNGARTESNVQETEHPQGNFEPARTESRLVQNEQTTNKTETKERPQGNLQLSATNRTLANPKGQQAKQTERSSVTGAFTQRVPQAILNAQRTSQAGAQARKATVAQIAANYERNGATATGKAVSAFYPTGMDVAAYLTEVDKIYKAVQYEEDVPATPNLTNEMREAILLAAQSDISRIMPQTVRQQLASDTLSEEATREYQAVMQSKDTAELSKDERQTAFQEVYNAAFTGTEANAEIADQLPEDLRNRIVETAKKDRTAYVQGLERKGFARSAAAGVEYTGTRYADSKGVIANVATARGLQRGILQDKTLGILDQFGKDLGIRVNLIDTNPIYNGAYEAESADVTIALDSEFIRNASIDATILGTFGHEVTHRMEQLAPKAYNALVTTVRNAMESSDFNRAVNRQMRLNPGIKYEQAIGEAVADFVGQKFAADEAFVDQLLGNITQEITPENRSAMEAFRDWVHQAIEWIRGNKNIKDPEKVTSSMQRVEEAITRLLEESKGAVNNATRIVTPNSVIKMDIDLDPATHSANPTDGERLSRRTWNESNYVTSRDEAAKDMAEALNVPLEKAKAYIDTINGVAKYIADNEVRLDYISADGGSAFVSNSEYGGSFDFTTMCQKARLFMGTFTAVQRQLGNQALTADEVLELRRMMKEKGYEVTCGCCYVEGSRANEGQFATRFMELYQAYYPDNWQPDLADLITPDGIEWVRRNHPECYEQYNRFWNDHGRLKESDPNLFASQQKPKMYQARTAYNGEILTNFRSSDSIEQKNRNGGVRMQSFSDFEIVHLIDVMQTIMDMSRVGLAGQAYTKVYNFADAFGNTGLKINLSLIAKGVDANGNIIIDPVEGMKKEDAIKLRNKYSDNVGTIIVCFNDEQVFAAMKSDFIDYIIPFHRSQWKKSQYSLLGLPEKVKDYTNVQNEKLLKQTYHEFRGRMVKDKATNFMPNNYWDFTKSGKENAERYLQLCAENNKRPKFYKFLTKNADGSYSLKADGSTDGYWKLLIDFKMYNNEGVGVPQMPVRPDFSMDEIYQMMGSYEGGHATFPAANDVVESFVKDHKKTSETTRYSVRESDERYIALAENPEANKAELQQMVNQAAQDAGYTTAAYHGTGSNFTVFDPEKIGRNYHGFSMLGKGFYFSDSQSVAREWGKRRKVLNVFLDLQNPFNANELITSGVLLDEYNKILKANNKRFKAESQVDAIYGLQIINGDDKGRSTELLKQMGYDGILLYHEKSMGSFKSETTEYVVFDSEQIKSADPVTYDSNGNIIPLSERFNSESPDIRYSTRDTEATAETEATDFSSAVEIHDQRETIRTAMESRQSEWKRGITRLDNMSLARGTARIIDTFGDILDNQQKTNMVNRVKNLASDIVERNMEYPEAMRRASRIARDLLFSGTDVDLEQAKALMQNDPEAAMSVDYIANVVLANIMETQSASTSMMAREVRLANERTGKAEVRTARAMRDLQEALEKNDRLKNTLAEVRAKRDAKIREGIESRKEQARKRMESRERKYLLSVMKRLDNAAKKAPAQLRDEIKAITGEFDLTCRRLTDGKVQKLEELKRWVDQREKEDPFFNPNPNVMKAIENMSKNHIDNITDLNEVRAITRALLNLENELREGRYMIDTQDRRDINAMGREVIDGIRNSRLVGKDKNGNPIYRPVKHTKGIDAVYTELVRPETFFRRTVGFDDNNPLYKLTFGNDVSLATGQKAMIDYNRRAHERFFKNYLDDKAFQRTIMGKHARGITINGINEQGYQVSLKVTPDLLMAIYMHSKNAQNLAHFVDRENRVLQNGVWTTVINKAGGMTVPDFDLYKAGKIEEAYRKGTKITMKLADIHHITSQLTGKEMAFIKAAQSYYSEMSQPEINRVSELLNGYSLATVENYFRINTDPKYRKADMESVKYDASVANQGWTNERIDNASNPILLYSLTDQLQRDIEGHSKYVGMAIPIRNFNKVYGVNRFTYDEDGNINVAYESSVQKELDKMYGSNANKYIENLMRDIQMPRNDSDFFGKMLSKIRSHYAKAVLTINLGVAVKQAASFPTAAAEIGWTPLMKSLLNTRFAGKMNMDIVNKYSPLMRLRTEGLSTQELGEMKDQGRGIPKVLNWIQGMDVMTIKKLWKASEYYVRANYKHLQVGSDAYYRQVGEVHSKVIEKTQPNYSALQRPQILRTKNELVKTLNMFKTQPFQNLNILMEAFGDLKAKQIAYKVNDTADNKAALNVARKRAAWAVSSQVMSGMIFALMQFAWDLARKKDEKYRTEDGELEFESAAKKIAINMGSNAFGMVPFGSVIFEAVETATDKIAKTIDPDAEPIFDAVFYGIDAGSATDSINDSLKGIVNVLARSVSMTTDIFKSINAAKEGEEYSIDWWNYARETAKDAMEVLQFAGIPADNAVNSMTALSKWILGGTMGTAAGNYYTELVVNGVTSSNKKKLLNSLLAIREKDPEQYEELYNIMIENEAFGTSKTESQKYIDDYIKNWEKVRTENGYTFADQAIYDQIREDVLASPEYAKMSESDKEAMYGVMDEYIWRESQAWNRGREGVEKGVFSDVEYLLFQMALKKTNTETPTHINQKEVMAAIDLMGWSDQTAAKYWDYLPSDSNNPYLPGQKKTNTKNKPATTTETKPVNPMFTPKAEEQSEPESVNFDSWVNGANFDNGELTIYLNGRPYTYHGVPKLVYNALKSADDKGAYYNKYIKGIYPYN